MNFEEPFDGWFTHLAWNIDLKLSGPFVRASKRRPDHQHRLARLAAQLTGQEGTRTAHALEVTAIPPIKGGPRYDLALLIHSDEPLSDALTARTAQLGLPAPFLIMNYAVIPGRVMPFLAGQLLRPSFYRGVRRRLREFEITPFPLFARRLDA